MISSQDDLEGNGGLTCSRVLGDSECRHPIIIASRRICSVRFQDSQDQESGELRRIANLESFNRLTRPRVLSRLFHSFVVVDNRFAIEQIFRTKFRLGLWGLERNGRGGKLLLMTARDGCETYMPCGVFDPGRAIGERSSGRCNLVPLLDR